MDKYAIYSYKFVDVTREGELFKEKEETQSDSSEEKRKVWLDRLFGEKNTLFTVKKQNKNDADDLPCTVLAHCEKFVLLRLENPKHISVWIKKQPKTAGEAASINKQRLESNPYVFIIIDCRIESKCRIAINIDTNVWRSTDKVAELIQASINQKLNGLNRDFNIALKPMVLPIDFYEHSRRLIKKEHLAVTKFTVYFTRGLISPKIEEIIKKDAYLKELRKRMFESKSAELTYYDPNGLRILDQRSKMLEHFVMLVASSPSDAFRLRISYEDGSTYICGKDVRMEFQMSPDTFLSLLGIGNLFPQNEIGAWFDFVNEEIERQKNAQ